MSQVTSKTSVKVEEYINSKGEVVNGIESYTVDFPTNKRDNIKFTIHFKDEGKPNKVIHTHNMWVSKDKNEIVFNKGKHNESVLRLSKEAEIKVD